MTTAPDQQPTRNRKWIYIGGALVAVIALILVLINVGTFDSLLHPKETKAQEECEETVRNELRSPSTAKFPNTEVSEGGSYVIGDLPDKFTELPDLSAYVVTGDVDGQNGFGATIRNDFNCRAVFSNGEFVGTELRFIQ